MPYFSLLIQIYAKEAGSRARRGHINTLCINFRKTKYVFTPLAFWPTKWPARAEGQPPDYPLFSRAS